MNKQKEKIKEHVNKYFKYFCHDPGMTNSDYDEIFNQAEGCSVSTIYNSFFEGCYKYKKHIYDSGCSNYTLAQVISFVIKDKWKIEDEIDYNHLESLILYANKNWHHCDTGKLYAYLIEKIQSHFDLDELSSALYNSKDIFEFKNKTKSCLKND